MKIIIEGEPKEIAALVLELQERQMVSNVEGLKLDDSGIKLCADDVLKDE